MISKLLTQSRKLLQFHCDILDEIDLKAATDQFQRVFIQHKLGKLQGNLFAKARLMGVDRSNFQRLIKRLGMR